MSEAYTDEDRKKQVIEVLQETLAKATRGELVEIVITARRSEEMGGDTLITSSSSPDCRVMAGALLDHAVMRLGYQLRQE